VSFTNAAQDSVTNLTVTINDAFGDVPAVGLVSIISVQAINPTELRLQVTGQNGAGVVIEATTNFMDWCPWRRSLVCLGVCASEATPQAARNELPLPPDPPRESRQFRPIGFEWFSS